MSDECGMINEKGKSDLVARTKAFALSIIWLYSSVPKTVEAQVLGKQMLRSGTSVGAQYREATRARSRAEFVSKIESALQELEETGYWLELFVDSGIIAEKRVRDICQERAELTAMLVASVKTAKVNRRNSSLS